MEGEPNDRQAVDRQTPDPAQDAKTVEAAEHIAPETDAEEPAGDLDPEPAGSQDGIDDTHDSPELNREAADAPEPADSGDSTGDPASQATEHTRETAPTTDAETTDPEATGDLPQAAESPAPTLPLGRRPAPIIGLENFEPPKPDQLGVLPAIGSMSMEALRAGYGPAAAPAPEPEPVADAATETAADQTADNADRKQKRPDVRRRPHIALVAAAIVVGLAAVLGLASAMNPLHHDATPSPSASGSPDHLATSVTCQDGTSTREVLATSDSVFWTCGKDSRPTTMYAYGPQTGEFTSTSVDWDATTQMATGKNSGGMTITFGKQLPGAVRLNDTDNEDPSAIPVTWSWQAGSDGEFQGPGSLRPVAGTPGKFGVALPHHTAEDQVRYLSQILAESAQGRDDLGPAVSQVRACGANSSIVDTIRGVRDNRQAVLDALAAASYDLIPDGSDMVSELTSAITWSLTADQQYLDWAQSAAGGCPTGKTTDADQSSDRAASHKSAFAQQWNSTIAPTFNVPEVSVGQI